MKNYLPLNLKNQKSDESDMSDTNSKMESGMRESKVGGKRRMSFGVSKMGGGLSSTLASILRQ